MNFPGLGKIIRPVSGRSPGFDGMDGQKANMMNFRWAIEKHQACLATDVAGSRHASPMNSPRPQRLIWSVSGNSSRLGCLYAQKASTMNFPRTKRLTNEISQA